METERVTTSRRQLWLLGVLGVAAIGLVAYQMWPAPSATAAPPPSNRRSARTAGSSAVLDPEELKVRLEALQATRPALGETDRNPFRFTPPPAPPAPPKPPPPAAAPVVPAGPPPPPPPPPIPPIPLKFMGTVEKGTLKVAALTDCKGYTFASREGEAVDGRYRLVKIGEESVVMEYLNGSGRTTIRKSGECPRTP